MNATPISIRQIERIHVIVSHVIALQRALDSDSVYMNDSATCSHFPHNSWHFLVNFFRQQEFYLHGNRLTHLRQCDRYLPVSIQTLTLDHNNIADLNEICTLSGLTSLNSISIQENPCVQMTNSV